jgi:hypothetical protein
LNESFFKGYLSGEQDIFAFDIVKPEILIIFNVKEMKKIIIPVFVLIAALLSCNKETVVNEDINGVGVTTDGSTRLAFRLTDAPGDYDEVNIDIVGAKAIINDSIIDLDVKAGVYNLLDFVNGKDTVIVDQQIPAGKLSQIRLILGDNNSVVVGKESFGMKTPSAQQSGLKLNVQATFLQGIAYEYIIDFDAARSIVRTGNGKHILKPVIKVYTKAVSGTIEGVVKPANAKPVVYAISAAKDTSSTKADTLSGRFMIRGLAAGTYNLSFVPVSPFKDTILKDIVVKTSMITKVDTLKFK